MKTASITGSAKEIGGMIKQARQAKKLTQDDVARMAKVSRSRVSQIENGDFGDNAFFAIAKQLGLDIQLTDKTDA